MIIFINLIPLNFNETLVKKALKILYVGLSLLPMNLKLVKTPSLFVSIIISLAQNVPETSH